MLLSFMQIVYIFSLFLCATTYFIYPAIIWIFSRIMPLEKFGREITPTVSIIIPAYNEERNIEKKIRNTLSLDYPRERMEIIIGSDGSDDNTAAMARRCIDPIVKIIEFKDNRGKTAVQNDLVECSKGEVLIFTDAAAFISKDALKKIVKPFADPRIGCVAGNLRFVKTGLNLTTQGQGIYWRYERKLREWESKLGSLVGVDGPLYAQHRDCFEVLENNIISDFISPLLVLAKGKKVVLAQGAIVEEEPTRTSEQEFDTRRRITLRGLTGLSVYLELINPFKHPFLACQIFFHKVLRWFVGLIVAINVMSCFALALWPNPFFRSLALAYILFILGVGVGWIGAYMGIKNRLLTIFYYFGLVNFAATMGIVDFFKKRERSTWKPVRE